MKDPDVSYEKGILNGQAGISTLLCAFLQMRCRLSPSRRMLVSHSESPGRYAITEMHSVLQDDKLSNESPRYTTLSTGFHWISRCKMCALCIVIEMKIDIFQLGHPPKST